MQSDAREDSTGSTGHFEAKLEELRTRMRNATVFAEVIDHFLEEIAFDEAFVEGCVPETAELSRALVQCIGQVVGHTTVLVGHVFRYSATDFVHGSFLDGGKVVIVLCFERDTLGMVGVMDPGRSEVRTARFRVALRPATLN